MRTLLYVGNIADSATAADLTLLFEQHGTVVATQIVVDPQSGQSLGFGFVEMATNEEWNIVSGAKLDRVQGTTVSR